MKIMIVIFQILFLHLFLFVGMGLKLLLPIPLPASMVGLIILLIALFTGLVKVRWIEKGGNWLLAELILFFIPSAVGIINYDELFGWLGIEMLAIIFLSTSFVMIATAFTAEKFVIRKRSVEQ